MVLEAQVTDVIEYGILGLWGNQAFTGRLRVVTVPNNVVTSQTLGDSTFGVPAWAGVAGFLNPLAGSHFYTINSGDVFAGLVTLRLQARVDTSGTKTLHASATIPLQVWAKNLGPSDLIS